MNETSTAKDKGGRGDVDRQAVVQLLPSDAVSRWREVDHIKLWAQSAMEVRSLLRAGGVEGCRGCKFSRCLDGYQFFCERREWPTSGIGCPERVPR